jgi:hypothetical protein
MIAVWGPADGSAPRIATAVALQALEIVSPAAHLANVESSEMVIALVMKHVRAPDGWLVYEV